VVTRWGVHPYIFAPKEETFKFLEDVLTEVCELFPSKFIHIGGDEAPKTQWKKSAFAQSVMKARGVEGRARTAKLVHPPHRNSFSPRRIALIGWDEIQEGGLPKTATMMVWRDAKWAKHALSQGNDIVMATTSHTYLDYYQAPEAAEMAKGKEFECIGGFLPLEKVYSYNPAFVAGNAAQEKQILGTQGQLWGEYIKDIRKAEYLALPRLAPLAEVAWSPQNARNFPDFLARLDGVMNHYEAAGVPFSRPVPPPKKETRDGSTVSSSLGTYQNNWPELAFDGREDTFFWADRALKEGDHFTLKLKAPLAKETTVTLSTGGKASKNGDKLENGILEATSDGTDWKPLATFENGSATAKAPAGTRQIRLKVTKPQENWLIIHEITVE
jgi:hexosaminidase